MGEHFRRRHLRAPLFSRLLYQDDDYVFKAQTLNISEGGILIENLPHIPEIKLLPIMFELPKIPNLAQMSRDRLMATRVEDMEKEILRVRCRIVRTFEGQSEVDKIFTTNIGCEFIDPPEKIANEVTNYVSQFGKNILFLLTLFEGRSQKKEVIHVLRHVTQFLGYPPHMSLPALRKRVLHDYQSLENS